MVSSKQLRHNLNRLPDAIPVGSNRVHRENFHPLFNLVLASRKKFSLSRAAAAFLPINLHDAKPADCDRAHVSLVAQSWNWDLLFVARLFYVKLPRGIKDR